MSHDLELVPTGELPTGDWAKHKLPDDDLAQFPDEYTTPEHLSDTFNVKEHVGTWAGPGGPQSMPVPVKPWLCPHCGRDRHPESLRRTAAHMLDGMCFDPGYDAATDDSHIVCIGADYHGPILHGDWDRRTHQIISVKYGKIPFTHQIISVKYDGELLPPGNAFITVVPDVSGFAAKVATALTNIMGSIINAGFADMEKAVADLTATCQLWLHGDTTPPTCDRPDTGLDITGVDITFGPPWPLPLWLPLLKLSDRTLTKTWWWTITKAVHDAKQPTPPPTPGYDFTTLIATLENNHHHPTEGNHHEDQRIPRRSARRNRHPLHQRAATQRRR